MQLFRNNSGQVESNEGYIKQYVSRDSKKRLYRETVITRIYMAGSQFPAIMSDIPWPSYPAGLSGIMATHENGLYRVDYTFQTTPNQAGSRMSNEFSGIAGSNETYELMGSLTQEPITSHPKIGTMLSLYANPGRVKDGKVLWKETLPNGGTNGTDRDGNAITNANPFANVDSYLEVGATFTASKTVNYRGLNLNLHDVGKIATSSIIGTLPPAPQDDGRNWLYAGCSMQQRGYAYTYTVKYLLSGPGGWNRDIYT